VYLTNALLANTLYIPNLDDITEELARDSQVPDWIASNFNSKPKSTPHSSERHRHIIQRRVRSFTNILTDEGPVVEEVATMLDEQLDTWGFDVFLFNDKTHGWPLFHLFSAIMQVCLLWRFVVCVTVLRSPYCSMIPAVARPLRRSQLPDVHCHQVHQVYRGTVLVE